MRILYQEYNLTQGFTVKQVRAVQTLRTIALILQQVHHFSHSK